MGEYNLDSFRLDDFKNHISIAEFIKMRGNTGFIMKRSGKYIRAYIPALDKEGNVIIQNKNVVKKANIIIGRVVSNNKGAEEIKEVYFDLFDFQPKKPKTIVDFIHEYIFQKEPGTKIDFKNTIGLMKQYMNHDKFVDIKNSEFDLIANTKKKSTNNKKIEKDVTYLYASNKTFSYLKGRGITSQTLSSPEFIGCYGQNKEGMPAFLLKNIDGKKQTVQWINYDESTGEHSDKRFAAGIEKTGSLYQTNFLSHTNALCIIESPEKAMAHHQLYRTEMERQKYRPAYLSSCGFMTSNDAAMALKIGASKGIDRYLLCFDNDKAGYKSTISFYLAYNGIDMPEYTRVEAVDQETFRFTLPKEATSTLPLSISKHPSKKDYGRFFSLEIKPSVLFQEIQTEKLRIHQSITKDHLDDMNANLKLPFKFKTPTNKLER